MSSTIFDGVIDLHYEKLNLLSKLIPKFYIELHAKVEISRSFRRWIFIKFCMQVEYSYIYIYIYIYTYISVPQILKLKVKIRVT